MYSYFNYITLASSVYQDLRTPHEDIPNPRI